MFTILIWQWFLSHETESIWNRRKKIGKLDFIKIKYVCASKDTVERMKREFRKWEKILLSHISDKDLISRIYKEFLSLNKKMQAIQLKKKQMT